MTDNLYFSGVQLVSDVIANGEEHVSGVGGPGARPPGLLDGGWRVGHVENIRRDTSRSQLRIIWQFDLKNEYVWNRKVAITVRPLHPTRNLEKI